ncbi:hypothetical protein H5410_047283 [Solanum commersonii]|uniref:Uncharacterized protein n=1 Tax=Solanum commersonii TaxID=4109 RepID=A0A9J5XEM7_SOLCO|nr:hypothetical protein H5410_047283 [Solanum commersonii]
MLEKLQYVKIGWASDRTETIKSERDRLTDLLTGAGMNRTGITGKNIRSRPTIYRDGTESDQNGTG